MWRCFRRVILGTAVIAGTTASAQPYPANPSASSERFVAGASDSYAVDEADADVVEFPRDATQEPRVTSAAPREPQSASPGFAEDRYAEAPSRATSPAVEARGDSGERPGNLRPTGHAPQPTCREYQQTIVANGRERLASGEACLQPDGSWRVVTPPSMDAPAAEKHAGYAPAPRHITSASMRAQERLEARGYGERSYSAPAYRPRRSPLYNLFFGWLD
jgi:hypothetical protein